MDRDALAIVRRLSHEGHTSYFVGGCVRDVLLGKVPKDFDVATSALPQQVRRAFRSARLIGRRFKLAHVHCQGGKIIEVATFRQSPAQSGVEDGLIVDDNEYGTPETDAFRRDFTINALFYDPLRHQIIDFVGGLRDIKRRLIRSIGAPQLRFIEDPIRILRAIKFAGKLNLDYEDQLARAIESERDSLAQAAAPRLQQELLRYLQGGSAERTYTLLEASGALSLILPELSALFHAHPESRGELHELLRALDALIAEDPEWLSDIREEAIIALILWPLISRLVLGELYSATGYDTHSGEPKSGPKREPGGAQPESSGVAPRLHYEPSDLKLKELRFVVIRLITPFCTRVGMSLKTLYTLSRVLTVQLLLELELHEPRSVKERESSLRSHLSGAQTYETLLLIKTRCRAGHAAPSLERAIEPLWRQRHRRVAQPQEGERPKRALGAGAPVVKPKERRKRNKRAR